MAPQRVHAAQQFPQVSSPPQSGQKRKFATTTFLADGSPTGASDVPRDIPPHLLHNHHARAQLNQGSTAAAPTGSLAAWARRLVGAPVQRLKTAVAQNIYPIFRGTFRFAQRYIPGSSRAAVVAPANPNKRRQVEVPPQPHPHPHPHTSKVTPGALRISPPRGQLPALATQYRSPPRPRTAAGRAEVAKVESWLRTHEHRNDVNDRIMTDVDSEEYDQRAGSVSDLSMANAAARLSLAPRDFTMAGALEPPSQPPASYGVPRRTAGSDSTSDGEEVMIPVFDEDEYTYFKLEAERDAKKLKDRLLGPSEEDLWVADSKREREEMETVWKSRFDEMVTERNQMSKQLVAARGRIAEMRNQRDEERAKLAQLEEIAKLAGTTLEAIIASSGAHNQKIAAAADTTAPAGTSVVHPEEASKAIQLVDDTSNATQLLEDAKGPRGDKRASTRRVRFAAISPDQKANSPPAEPLERLALATEEEEVDPWLVNVDLAELEALTKLSITDRPSTKPDDLATSVPQPKLISPLSPSWIAKCQEALAARPTSKKLVGERSDITPAALATLVGKNWLNDAVINEFVQHIVARQQQQDAAANAAANRQPNGGGDGTSAPAAAAPAPAYVALNSNWWNTIHNSHYSVDDGLSKVLRWAKRAKIDGQKLLGVKNLYIPINASSHWTLLSISGTGRTIEYLNSLDGCGPSDKKVFEVVRRYLELHLGPEYDPQAWSELHSRSAQQVGGFDCGAFVCFNALALARGLVPGEAFGSDDIGTGRQRISATLLNSGFSGELDW